MQMGELYCHVCSSAPAGLIQRPHRRSFFCQKTRDSWFRAHSGTVVEIQHDVRHSLSPGPVLPVVGRMFRTETLRDPCTAVDTFYSDISVPQSWGFWT